MKVIGGYFGLEMNIKSHYHYKALRLNTARNALEWLLVNRAYHQVYVPAFCCASLLEPLRKTKTVFTPYHLNEAFEIEGEIPRLKPNEALLYVDYFGIKNGYIENLYKFYGKNLIIDNSQAFFKMPLLPEIDTFYSARKFFGVPDGAYLYAPGISDDTLEKDISYDRMEHLLTRIDLNPATGFESFRKNEMLISGRPVRRMSTITSDLLSSIDYMSIREKRKRNFLFLHEELACLNRLKFSKMVDFEPMIYPLLVDNVDLRRFLIEHEIYCAQYWVNTLAPLNKQEKIFRDYLIPLPIDQRYDLEDMSQLIKTIKSCI